MTESTTVLSWSIRPSLVVLCWLTSAIGLAWLVLTNDVAGKLIAVVLCAAGALAGLYGTVARPRLTATTNGITLRGLRQVHQWSWSEFSFRIIATQRFGRRSTLLELDIHHEQLFLLGQLELGTEPQDVAAALERLRNALS